MVRLVRSLLISSVLLLPPGISAQGDFDPFEAEGAAAAPASKVELLSEVASIAPGKPFEIAIKLTHPEGWHSYFVNPGSLGLTLDPAWKLPEGFEVGRVAWPVPHIGSTAGQVTYGYEGTVYHLFRITPPTDLAAGNTVKIQSTPSWQICDDKNCVPEPPFSAPITLTLELPVADQAGKDPAQAEAFEAARAMLPAVAPEGLQVEAFRGTGSVTLVLSPASMVDADYVHFFDYDQSLDAQAKPTVERSEEEVRITIPRNPDFDGPALMELSGILAIGQAGHEIEAPLLTAPAPPVSFGSLLAILGGMFIGGLILNLMPCVFPVIGLKIMGFVQQAGEDRRKIALHGLIFTAGVLLSFWILSGLLLALREGVLGNAGANEVGWGYQLQNPWVVWALMLVMFILALNMFGVFEIGTSATSVGGNLVRKQGAAGSFFSGILATVVATPCSAPFLGAALGATFALSSPLFMLSFTAMALGLAAPYLVLSVFPKLVQKLPRPGPWMESFKQAMSFLLFATAGFLLWVYVLQISVGAMLNVVLGLTAIGIAGWVYGRWCVISRSKRTRIIGFVVMLGFAAFGLAQTRPPKKGLEWADWSREAVEAALAADRPVYVDFTAAWCVTCQVNKKTAYSAGVRKLLEDNNVLLLMADNTNPRPEINAAIRDLGRAAVPVNVLYVPGDPEPHLTTEVFTAGYLEEFLSSRLRKEG